MTQASVARLMGLSQSQYSRVARGICQPRVDAMKSLEKWLKGSARGKPLPDDQIAKLIRSVELLRKDIREALSQSGRALGCPKG